MSLGNAFSMQGIIFSPHNLLCQIQSSLCRYSWYVWFAMLKWCFNALELIVSWLKIANKIS
jgi:hypothetical protein